MNKESVARKVIEIYKTSLVATWMFTKIVVVTIWKVCIIAPFKVLSWFSSLKPRKIHTAHGNKRNKYRPRYKR